ncbi:putative molybdopterin biosynthesis protein [Sporomusaceae bacterium BoRhaA]|uniref:substrate-binding domain-containing protein n=1 Tax=Pelorhabdus rhamnosifermentans TaxID=2772457 RepID=UPI001C060EF4|nr:helix-turn-helix transcriptional regulator [Pelorhabdus rhamnosifermentans]MBU2702601.1 putative molybdopterin biosynthesis protein [Pelorhabdus rhamnosifermentans]
MTEIISYTPDEVAKILKISRFTVYEMIKRGDLRAYHIGRKVRIEAPDLEIYINNSKTSLPSLPAQPAPTDPFPISTDHDLILCGQDIILDILTRHLKKVMPNVRFLRNYIGSIDGLLALYRGTANAVTTHLWDSDTNTYNTPYVRRLLPGHQTLIVNLAYRIEGFYVAKGNPKNILTWQDLTKQDVRFVNRERGSGARVLLDEKLHSLNIDHKALQGYECEEMSHLAIASYVARGEADVGLGTEKAAMQVANIDFIPLQKERYDLVIHKEDADLPLFKALFAILQSNNFQAEVAGMGGYDLSHTGRIMAEA